MQHLSKFQWHFSQKYLKNPKIYIEPKKTLNNQSNLEKKEQSWRHHTSLFKAIYQAVVIKTDNWTEWRAQKYTYAYVVS